MEYKAVLHKKALAGLPIIATMIQQDELHNPFITMQHVNKWMEEEHAIWVSEYLEQHFFTWDGETWTRTQEERERSWNLRYRPPEVYLHSWGLPPWAKSQQPQLI
jgi:hypothetical protein